MNTKGSDPKGIKIDAVELEMSSFFTLLIHLHCQNLVQALPTMQLHCPLLSNTTHPDFFHFLT